MLAMVFLDLKSTNHDSLNDPRFAHYVQHPVQKQGRPPNRRLAQRSWFTHLEWSEWDERPAFAEARACQTSTIK
jgi:hypothetical protein